MADSSEQSAARARRDSAGDYAVRFEDVTKRYGDVVAVDDVSFDVDRKEFLTLLGPSGAGKSTLLHMIAGFTQPTEGEIYIEGEPVSAQAPYERNIGMVFQSMALFPHKTVRGNIAFPLKMRRHDPATIDDRIAEMLDLVRLPGIEDRRIDELSGGQQQRIAIARALAFEPSLLLLDEPLSSLDKKLREEMRHEITRIHDETDVTTIHVTHNQEEALTMADRIAVINEGAVAQLADAAALYRQPATSFVADFVGSTNIFPGEVVDKGTIRAAGGSLELAAELSGQRAGDAVEIALRHEQIRIDEGPLGVENEYEATVAESVFRGDLIDYRVDVDGLNADLEISQLNARATRVFEAGDVVHVGWNRDNVLVYPR